MQLILAHQEEEKDSTFTWSETIILSIPLLLFLFFLIHGMLLTKPLKRKNLPPSPRTLPIIGNLHQLGNYPHRSLRSLSRQYGDLMLLHLGSKPTLIVSSARTAHEIMKTHDAIFSNRPQETTANKLLYDGKDIASAPYGEYWRQMRSIVVVKLLSNNRVRSFRHVREEETALMIEKIKRMGQEPMNLSEMLVTLMNDVVCRVALGRKYSGKGAAAANFKDVLKEFGELLGSFFVGDFIPWLAWIHRLNGLDGRVDKLVKQFDELLEEIVEDHVEWQKKQKLENNDVDLDEEEELVKDFVNVLLDVQRDEKAGFPVGRDTIKALIMDVFAAGTHTTYSVLEWAMTELLRHPLVMKQLQAEVRGIVGTKEEISKSDLEEMKYLKAVMKETLRLHPPVPLLVPRESTKDIQLNGYDIAAGTRVFINAWAIHTDPAHWEEPEEFRPERFLDSSVDFKGQDFQLIPFGAGRRGCPGISFSVASIELVLANLMHRFDWALTAGTQGATLDMSETTGLTAHRKNPLITVATLYYSS
ncbi:hypothetical protein Dimus_004732 [Dionaea muscipula]